MRDVRDREQLLPLIAVSTAISCRDRIAALDAGADDVLVMPFDTVELLARIRSVGRRSTGARKELTPLAPPAIGMHPETFGAKSRSGKTAGCN